MATSRRTTAIDWEWPGIFNDKNVAVVCCRVSGKYTIILLTSWFSITYPVIILVMCSKNTDAIQFLVGLLNRREGGPLRHCTHNRFILLYISGHQIEIIFNNFNYGINFMPSWCWGIRLIPSACSGINFASTCCHGFGSKLMPWYLSTCIHYS